MTVQFVPLLLFYPVQAFYIFTFEIHAHRHEVYDGLHQLDNLHSNGNILYQGFSQFFFSAKQLTVYLCIFQRI